MSPVDLLAPDFDRFPNFKNAKPMNCSVGPTETLFLPSYWWHEVQSYPDQNEPVNNPSLPNPPTKKDQEDKSAAGAHN